MQIKIHALDKKKKTINLFIGKSADKNFFIVEK